MYSTGIISIATSTSLLFVLFHCSSILLVLVFPIPVILGYVLSLSPIARSALLCHFGYQLHTGLAMVCSGANGEESENIIIIVSVELTTSGRIGDRTN